VLRAMDHYDVHQRSVQAAVLDGVASSMAALLDRVESLHAELRTTRGELSRQGGRLAASEQDLGAAVEELAGQQRRVNVLEGRMEEESKRTHALFLERDRRADHLDMACSQLERDTAALVHGAERSAEVPVGAAPVLCDAGVLLFPADDQVVRAWVAYHRSWERPEAELLERLARGRHGTFLDVGAHVGYHTVRLLSLLPEVRAVAVEPNPAVLDMLRANLATAGIDERVTVLPVAAWDRDTVVGLHQVETDNSGDYRVVPDGALRVDALRLDTVAAVISGEVAVVKVDLQGRDHRAIAGLDAVLRCDRPDVVCEFCPDAIEELGDDPHQVLEGYRALGYAAHDVDGTPQSSTAALVRAARDDPSGFRTVWLRPA
nr:FkbM family methyltransferase [Pseudonocardiales bacterium]